MLRTWKSQQEGECAHLVQKWIDWKSSMPYTTDSASLGHQNLGTQSQASTGLLRPLRMFQCLAPTNHIHRRLTCPLPQKGL